MIPLLHDFTDENVLVVGGGAVGARKARTFAAEARVVVVSPRFEATDYGGAERVRARVRPDSAGDWIDRIEPALVAAATDVSALNEALVTAARDRGVLVNRADTAGDRSRGHVALPAIASDGPVVIGVGTGGTSPALAAHLRDRLADELAGAEAMADLTAELRSRLVDGGVPPDRRHAALRAVVRDDAVWTGLEGGKSNAYEQAETVIRDVTGERP